MHTMTMESEHGGESSVSSGGPSSARRRRQWTEEEKAATLVLLAESNMSVAEFSRAMDIPEATLYLWRRQAGSDLSYMSPGSETGRFVSPAIPSVQFAEVQVVDGADRDVHEFSRGLAQGVTMALRWPTGMTADISGLDASTLETVVRTLMGLGGMSCCR
jgi:transposase-like protein